MTIKNPFTAIFSRKKESDKPGFGTFYGVYLPGVLSMFGVIIYLRFAWIIGTLGLFQTLTVVSLSCIIVFITVLSISSMATNMHVGGGGTYYIVSRSLGIEVGSAIGVPLFIAQALAISFCTAGFAESIQPFFPSIPQAYLGAATLIVLMGLVYTSASIALKTQFVIFLIIVASLASLFLGHSQFVETTPEMLNNRITTSFWAGFALFFPATTGVESGVSMSGDLRSPRKSLPLGTIAVLITGFLVYLAIPLVVWSKVSQDLLISDPIIFQHIAKFQSLIIAGIWAATLSSVLSGLLAAPRTLQALALDGIFPKFLAKEWGKTKEPRIATLVCFVIAMVGVFYGSIDIIAPILTMFYLIAYATLNLATGLEALLSNPSWRPTFRIPWMLSMLGVIFCMMTMLMIDAGATLIALLFVVLIYFFTKKRNFANDWEDIRQGILVLLSRFVIYKLANKQISGRSWRPNFLVLSDSPMQESQLVNVTSAISKDKGFLTLASVFSPQHVNAERASRWKKIITTQLQENKVEALVEFCMDDNLLSGAKTLLTNYGMGSLSPNTLVLGGIKKSEMNKDYFGIIQAASSNQKNVLIIRDKYSTLKPKNKIYIWWDEHSRTNSELMLLLTHMLQSNRSYRKSTIRLNSIVSSEVGKEQRLRYFHDFFAQGRFSITPHIYLKAENQNVMELMREHSAAADLVFMGMRAPKMQEDMEAYAEYYYQLMQDTSEIPHAIFVMGSESLDFRQIFK